MIIGVVKESLRGESRVAASPTSVSALIKLGFTVYVQKGAGTKASFEEQAYIDAGAEIVPKKKCWQGDLLLKVNAPTFDEIEQINDGATLISFISPAQSPDLLKRLKEKSITTLAMDMVPRMTRSQSLDALSSMANIAGYRAVIEATNAFGRFLTGQITAAGNLPPAKILIIGAGVAGLAAIGTAGSLGAIVRAFDTRPEVQEQIESMGAEFLVLDYQEEDSLASTDGYAKEMSKAFIDAEMALFAEQAKDVDIIITTAMIPGKKSPTLITESMIKSMKPGSVIVDLAAAGGGNCELTTAGKVINKHGVTIIGYTDLVSRLPNQSSQLYANNVVNLLKLLCKENNGEISLDIEDQVIRNMLVVQGDEIMFPPPEIKISATPVKPVRTSPGHDEKSQENTDVAASPVNKLGFAIGGSLLFAWIASVAPSDFLAHFTVFVLACIIGYYVVWNVTHALHTPLMSVTNAISGIIIVGALLQVGSENIIVQVLAGIAILIATINIVGGFFVTKRMLKMFRK
ncbi:Re/Si-specific NAD(P)(+) transhydrogenase subunit alpha [Thalassotalea sp. 1_MG-2023]|uniref:Re/Si-specific NAD(P)(+) transhydrogenase subunit alpha n=1 Tax=Thalassotalea sp. 1_MG-2023 TaxID=3062680 RepID=UPI0026E3390D|nr:Re/Si-specific NAD(P)(+) transhydrogenase subunit alpha [Thalassotalea sp. 1_MG-2023]MDO6427290.1 Re/Si-specific NAD(P)(+) transhydrogenase subunit alpha [Thalassotalea sp. 1_MG-2023]